MYVSTERRARLSRAEQQARTRAALLDAAAEVFIERGFLASGVEAISERAGFSRGAFYSNFESKEELFAELLQDRVYRVYRGMAEQNSTPDRPSLRQVGEQLAAIQADTDGRWLFRLWLELLAHAGRDERFRAIAAGFWKGNRLLTANAIQLAYDEVGEEPPLPAEQLATTMIALDIGLALQNFVDPAAVPLTIYPEVWEALFTPVAPGAERRARRTTNASGSAATGEAPPPTC